MRTYADGASALLLTSGEQTAVTKLPPAGVLTGIKFFPTKRPTDPRNEKDRVVVETAMRLDVAVRRLMTSLQVLQERHQKAVFVWSDLTQAGLFGVT